MMIDFTGKGDCQSAFFQIAGKVHELPPKLISKTKYKIPVPNLQSESGFQGKRERCKPLVCTAKYLLQFLHGGQAFFQLCNEIAMLCSFFALCIDNSLGCTGNKLLVG